MASKASVSSLEIKRCDDLVVKSNLDPPISLQLNLPLGRSGFAPATAYIRNSKPSDAPEGYTYEPMCLRLDESNQALQLQAGSGGEVDHSNVTCPCGPHQEWTLQGMTRFLPATYDAAKMVCLADTGGGSYAAVYMLVPVFPSTSTSTRTSTRVMPTTVVPVEVVGPDGGMVLGAMLAGCALVLVCSVIGWQAYAGNVKVSKPDCQVVQDAYNGAWKGLKSLTTPKKVAPEPKPVLEAPTVWESPKVPKRPTLPPPMTEARARDVEEHFWDWANELASAVRPSEMAGPFRAQGTPPGLPHLRSYSGKKDSADDKDEYFQSFAEELRESITSVPGMITDSATEKAPPPPPPKTLPNSSPTMPPPKQPSKSELSAMSSIPPRMELAERIDVRVDQAFSDWAHDFAVAPIIPPKTRSAPPPPPPRPPQRSQLPHVPQVPPRPPIGDRSGFKASPARPNEHWEDNQSLRIAAAPLVPRPPCYHELSEAGDPIAGPPHIERAIFSPPAGKARSQLLDLRAFAISDPVDEGSPPCALTFPGYLWAWPCPSTFPCSRSRKAPETCCREPLSARCVCSKRLKHERRIRKGISLGLRVPQARLRSICRELFQARQGLIRLIVATEVMGRARLARRRHAGPSSSQVLTHDSLSHQRDSQIEGHKVSGQPPFCALELRPGITRA